MYFPLARNNRLVNKDLIVRSIPDIKTTDYSDINEDGSLQKWKSSISKATDSNTTIKSSKSKFYNHPWADRTLLSDAYENPVSNREAWWRAQLKVTPIPGAYDLEDFVSEINKTNLTYRFKDQGRDGPFQLQKEKAADRATRQPDMYNYHYRDFLEELSKKPVTYRFKDEERDAKDVLNFGVKDKSVTVPPNTYAVENYLAINGTTAPAKNYMFRSQTKRFPAYIYGPKKGPSPNSYHVRDTLPNLPTVTSCFKSKTRRFDDAL